MTTVDIPEHCHIRWQAALAVLEDLLEDETAPFDMNEWGANVKWDDGLHTCRTAGCFAGYIHASPYCRQLGMNRYMFPGECAEWLLGSRGRFRNLYNELFSPMLTKSSRKKTLEYLQKRIKKIFKASTGKDLVAPLTFWID